MAAILQHTPSWVWVLLAFLVFRGVKSMRGGTTKIHRLAIVPVIFTLWGLYGLAAQPATSWLAWLSGILLGLAIGFVLARRSTITADRTHGTITLPGSPVPLVLMLLVFIVKFWLGFELAMHAASPGSPYLMVAASVSGAVAGIFAGRFLVYVQACRHQDGVAR
ncbi:MAG: DUF6622 family protein [Janthinobacterium lividum]